MRTRFAAAIAVATLAVFGASCGEANPTGGFAFTGNVNDASVRLINALTAAQALDFVVDGRVAASGTQFGGASPYIGVSAGTHRLQAQAWEEVAEGRIEEATQRLRMAGTRLFDAGEVSLASTIEQEATRLLRVGTASDEGRKRIRYGTRGLVAQPEAGVRNEQS